MCTVAMYPMGNGYTVHATGKFGGGWQVPCNDLEKAKAMVARAIGMYGHVAGFTITEFCMPPEIYAGACKMLAAINKR